VQDLKVYGRVEVQFPSFLTLALDAGKWSAPRPCRFTNCERGPGTQWSRSWVGIKTGLDVSEKIDILLTPV